VGRSVVADQQPQRAVGAVDVLEQRRRRSTRVHADSDA